PIATPAMTIVRTNALTPPLRSLRYTPIDSAQPTPWMIQASVPRNAHVVMPEPGSRRIAPIDMSLAGVMPPSSAAIAATRNTIAMPTMSVDPNDVTEPIHLAPRVETYVLMKKIVIDRTAMTHGWIATASPVIMYAAYTRISGSSEMK